MSTDPVQKAIDDYVLMERKAKAWDMLYKAVLDGESLMPINYTAAQVRSSMDRMLDQTVNPLTKP